jgi:hypothetical protein
MSSVIYSKETDDVVTANGGSIINNVNERESDLLEVIHFHDLFESGEQYPENVADRGVPQNTIYSYISTTFLNGFINYVEIKHVMMIERYTEFNDEKIKKYIEHLKSEYNTDYSGSYNTEETGKVVDDIILIGETEESIWLFWSDRDCSDSCIGRVAKSEEITTLLVKESLIRFIGDYDDCSGKYAELPIPRGWITL